MGIIIPILKDGDKQDGNNYHGITLLPVNFSLPHYPKDFMSGLNCMQSFLRNSLLITEQLMQSLSYIS